MKKIVILNGSPRKAGNTAALTTEFKRGAEEADGNLLRGHGRASALLMAAEGYGFEDVVLYDDHLMEHLKWKKFLISLNKGKKKFGRMQVVENSVI